jgi:hypothetical protein
VKDDRNLPADGNAGSRDHSAGGAAGGPDRLVAVVWFVSETRALPERL